MRSASSWWRCARRWRLAGRTSTSLRTTASISASTRCARMPIMLEVIESAWLRCAPTLRLGLPELHPRSEALPLPRGRVAGAARWRRRCGGRGDSRRHRKRASRHSSRCSRRASRLPDRHEKVSEEPLASLTLFVITFGLAHCSYWRQHDFAPDFSSRPDGCGRGDGRRPAAVAAADAYPDQGDPPGRALECRRLERHRSARARRHPAREGRHASSSRTCPAPPARSAWPRSRTLRPTATPSAWAPVRRWR